MRRPGVEPGSTAWKATMLTVTPPTHSLITKSLLLLLHHYSIAMWTNMTFSQASSCIYCINNIHVFPSGLVVRIPRSHRGGRGSIPRLGTCILKIISLHFTSLHFISFIKLNINKEKKIIQPNVGLEPTTPRLRVSCSTD